MTGGWVCCIDPSSKTRRLYGKNLYAALRDYQDLIRNRTAAYMIYFIWKEPRAQKSSPFHVVARSSVAAVGGENWQFYGAGLNVSSFSFLSSTGSHIVRIQRCIFDLAGVWSVAQT
jgi:hypothetical protein